MQASKAKTPDTEQVRRLRWAPELRAPGFSERGEKIANLHRKHPPGAERTQKVLRELEKDAAVLLALAEGLGTPEAVSEAAEAFRAALTGARQTVEDLDRAGTLAVEARNADVQAAAEAIRAGRPAPKELQVTRARQEEEAALIALDGAEQAAVDAHLDLTEAARLAWPQWRRNLVNSAVRVDTDCKKTAAKLAGILQEREALVSAVTSLDGQVTGRYPELGRAVRSERRCGVPIYEATRPGHRGKATAEVMAAMGTIQEHVQEEAPWLEWAPPGDPQHDELLTKPLDTTAQWVREAILPKDMICPECGWKLPDDCKIDPETLKPVCDHRPKVAAPFSLGN